MFLTYLKYVTSLLKYVTIYHDYLLVLQVNQLLQVAQKCQTTISESGPDGISQPDIQANSVM